MKKLFYLLILLTAGLLNINLYAGAELPVTELPVTALPVTGSTSSDIGTPATGSTEDLSFADFLKQLETKQNLDKESAQDKNLNDNEGERLEREIVTLYNQKITPLANDISKIVQSPDAKKALEEKIKEREQKQKEAERRIEKMKLKHPSGYTPSYRPSSGYGRDYSPSSYKGRSDRYGTGYDGYTPGSSYWDKNKPGESKLESKEPGKAGGKSGTGGKSESEDKEKKHGGSGGDKDVKKAIASVDHLTKEIREILSRENKKIGDKTAIHDLATHGTLVRLNNLFDKREKELWNIPEDNKDLDKKSSKQVRGLRTKGRVQSKTKVTGQKVKGSGKEDNWHSKIKDFAKEKKMWEQFAPQIVSAIQDPEGMAAAQNAGSELLKSLKLYEYISDFPAGYESEISKKEKKEEKEEPESPEKSDSEKKAAAEKKPEAKGKTDSEKKSSPTLNRIKINTQRIEKLITQNIKDLKPESKNPADIEKMESFLAQILKLFNERDMDIAGLDNPKEVMQSKEETKMWGKLLPILIQAVTYSEEKTGRELLDSLELNEYITASTISSEISKIEAKLLAEKAKLEAKTRSRATMQALHRIAQRAHKIWDKIKDAGLKKLVSKFQQEEAKSEEKSDKIEHAKLKKPVSKRALAKEKMAIAKKVPKRRN